ncbi:hypothetical protein RSSE_p0134 (plasmid) [Ralstonia solanacearum]|nr:hypothetical protein RSSE_p0134 [Ralstonia solanacearum]
MVFFWSFPPKWDQRYPGPTMKRCPECFAGRPYKRSDGRSTCRACGKRCSWTSVWDSARLSGCTEAHADVLHMDYRAPASMPPR